MKQFWKAFVSRGFFFCWGGPLVLAVIYGVLGDKAVLSGGDAAMGIASITVLAFIAAGITAVYQIESLPLFPALLIHGSVLYGIYLTVYLLNGWLATGITPLLIFTGIFIGGYAVIWLVIYLTTLATAKRVNRSIRKTAG